MTRPRVLIIAEAANPDWVSVPLIGWQLSRALVSVADVHLVTQIRNRDAILATGLVEGVDFTAIDSEALSRPLWQLGTILRMGEGKGWTTLQALNAISYPYFERLVWKRFGKAIKAGNYDVVHRVTPISPTQSGVLARRCAKAGVPYIIGPLNGGVPWPRAFDAARRAEREWLSYLRGLYKLMPGPRGTLNHAAAILTGSRHTAGDLPATLDPKVIWLPENAIDPNRFASRPRPVTGPLRACFIGRMVPYKGPDILLEAAAPLLRDGRMQLDMIGDGPMLPGLKEQADALGIAGAITFHGWVAHSDVASVAGKCSVLSFPSIREFGGGVVLEAMAMGLAPLIVDYAGPSELVGPDTGFTIPLGGRASIVRDLAAELERLTENRGDVAATGDRARARVLAHFTWSAKAAQIAEVYDWVLGRRAEKPNFDHIALMTTQTDDTEKEQRKAHV